MLTPCRSTSFPQQHVRSWQVELRWQSFEVGRPQRNQCGRACLPPSLRQHLQSIIERSRARAQALECADRRLVQTACGSYDDGIAIEGMHAWYACVCMHVQCGVHVLCAGHDRVALNQAVAVGRVQTVK